MSGRILPEISDLIVPPENLRGLPILVQHGEFDQKLTVAHGRRSQRILSGLPVALDYREYAMRHEITAKSLAEAASWLDAQILRADAATATATE